MGILVKKKGNMIIEDLLFPKLNCVFCGKNILNDRFVCNNCKKKYKPIFNRVINNDCDDYLDEHFNKYIKEHIYFYKYEDIRNLLLNFKFKDKSYIYRGFIELINSKELKNLKELKDFLKEYDLIISVPTHITRKIDRGYNQSDLIAKQISKVFNIKYIKNVLYKKENTISQNKLSEEKRKTNVINAFVLNKKKIDLIENKNILIIDDIYTTGSTVKECAKTIKDTCNVNQIGVLTIAKT